MMAASTAEQSTTRSTIRQLMSGPREKLPYSIHSSSGHTSAYKPSNILLDNPTDQSSRWTGSISSSSTSHSSSSTPASSSTTPQQLEEDKKVNLIAASGAGGNGGGGKGGNKKKEVQFVTLELERPSLVEWIGFGKYQKLHPCNLAEFAVYGGMSPDPRFMELLYHGGLKNDHVKEKFELSIRETEGGRRTKEVVLLPVKYIRIDAIAAHSQNYNVSIWHVWLEGFSSPQLMDRVQATYQEFRTTLTSHLVLSHLRRSNLLPAFHTLLQSLPPSTSSSFEHPLATQLHKAIVLNGQFTGLGGAEELLGEALESGLFNEWGGASSSSSSSSSSFESGGVVGKGKASARWNLISDGSRAEFGEEPSGRGGHQMVRVGRKILLFGGWDGERNLGDVWEFDLPLGGREEGAISGAGAGAGGGGAGVWRCLESGEDDDGDDGDDGGGGEGEERKRPRARSCHQLAVDESSGWVYLLGGMDPPPPPPPPATTRSPRPPTAAASASAVNEDSTNTGTNGTAGNGEMQVEDSEGEIAIPPTPPPPPPPSSRTTGSGSGSGSGSRGQGGNPWANDFWRYKAVGVGRGRWELLSEDTSVEGGPRLLFDHQMVVHGRGQLLYVFGGKHVQANSNSDDGKFSGMFEYDITRRKWRKLFGDPTPTDTFRSERLLSRIGHAMIFDPTLSSLFVFAGQRGEQYLADLWRIRLRSPSGSGDGDGDDLIKEESDEDGAIEDGDEGDSSRSRGIWRAGAISGDPSSPTPIIMDVSLVSSDYSSEKDSGGPPAGFTQRASIDLESGEWTLLTGLVTDRRSRTDVAGSEVWTRGREGRWECVEARGEEPVGRYAAQVVYDPLRKEHYLFGGNSQMQDEVSTRLGDFWKLRIIKPSPEEALRMAKFLVRKQRFTEMCQTGPTLSALSYLQTTLASVVDHTDETEASAFRACMASLLAAPASNNYEERMDEGDDVLEDGMAASMSSEDFASSSRLGASTMATGAGVAVGGPSMALYEQRYKLFESLLDFFPDSERSAKDDLRDMAARREETQRARFY